jgi:hypothetical protein
MTKMMGVSFVKRCRRKVPIPRSMRISEDVRRYAAGQGVSQDEAVKRGLEKKAAEFVKKGSEVYAILY